MDQRLSIITLGVNNLEKTTAFYEAMGWQKASKEDGVIAFDLQNMTLALFPLDELAKDAGIKIQRSGYSTVTLAHNLNTEKEVDELLARAEIAGGTIVKKAAKTFWGGYSGYFSDPDSHLWEVAYNPFSSLGKNGEFQWNGVK